MVADGSPAQPIECSTADHVRYITINRPERRNSLDDTTRHLLIEAFVATHSQAQFVENLGQQGYFSVMRKSLAMVGNSSSGIIEAASFGLPVVNIGERQGGRGLGGDWIGGHGRSSPTQTECSMLSVAC